MDFTNRLGHDNFVWWMGVVEDNNDPLHLGRCRVRIFGTHNPDLNIVPTESLPWASTIIPTTNPISSAAPLKGEYVAGFFLDGLSSQFPIMLGVVPGIPQEEPRPGVGFSALASEYNNTEIKLYNEKTDPVAPSYAPANKIQRPGAPTTPTQAYSANNTVTAWTNSQLVHSCDFRFLVNLGDLNIGAIENPITLIEQSITNAKNKAAAIIRTLLASLLDKFRIVFDGIIVALNLDPTGELSKIMSTARNAIRKINALSRKLAEYVGQAVLIASLLSELRQVVDWIKTLPSKVLAMLQDCLRTFSTAITAATSQIQALPGQVSNGLLGAFQSLETSTAQVITTAEQQQAIANVPNTLIQIVNSPDTANANLITTYITSTYSNANTIIVQTDSATFNVANTSTP